MKRERIPVRLFLIAAAADAAFQAALEKHLYLLWQRGLLENWQSVQPGEEVEEVFAEANLVILLLSADYHIDALCQDQMQRALEWQSQGEVQIVPVLLRPVEVTGAPFAHLAIVPTDGKAVTQWKDRDAAWTHITEAIRCILQGKPLLGRHVSQAFAIQRASLFAGIVVVVMVTGVLLTLFVPEARKLVGLDHLSMANPGDTLYIYKGHNADVVSLDWSRPNRVTSISDDRVEMEWDATTGTNVTATTVPVSSPTQQISSPDSGYTAYVTRPFRYRYELQDTLEVKDNTGKSILWDANGSTNLSKINFDEIANFEWSPDSTRFAIVDVNQILIWSVVDKHLLTRYSASNGCPDACEIVMAWSSSSRDIASTSSWGLSPITVWEADTGDIETSISSYGCLPTNIQWLPDDTQILVTTNDGCTDTDVNLRGELLFFEVTSRLGISVAIEKKTALVCPNTDSVGSRWWGMVWQWSPGRRYIAYDCGSSAYIYVWDNMSKRNVLIYKAHSRPIQAMAWSPDSTRIASSSDNTVRIWQVIETS